MKRIYFDANSGGFYGAYYPNAKPADAAMILMLGDATLCGVPPEQTEGHQGITVPSKRQTNNRKN